MAQTQSQRQAQKQIQKLSQVQIQALKFLAMNSRDLRDEIYKAAEENPAIEIVSDPFKSSREQYSSRTSSSGALAADTNQQALEAQENRGETLQQHLMEQLNLTKLSTDEYELCQKLIYNLDANGCYGSMLAPETLLDKMRPAQTKKMLDSCIDRIQRMDPVGTCCRTLEESLFVQAKIARDCPPLALFILDGNLELLNPPQPERVLKNLKEYLKNWHSKKFAPKIALDDIELDEEIVAQAIKYITSLNPRPAGEYISDTSKADFYRPDIILSVEKKPGAVTSDDFVNGIVSAASSTASPDFHYEVHYSNGDLPEIRVSPDFSFNAESVQKANELINMLKFRQSSIILQGCAIVSAQKAFFEKGPGNLAPLTRRKIAQQIGVNESTVSRLTGRKSNRSIQTEFGLFPAAYFFPSALRQSSGTPVGISGTPVGTSGTTNGTTISSEAIKMRLQKIIQDAHEQGFAPSDAVLTKQLNDEGIKISRRTVNKYRNQLGLENSYSVNS